MLGVMFCFKSYGQINKVAKNILYRGFLVIDTPYSMPLYIYAQKNLNNFTLSEKPAPTYPRSGSVRIFRFNALKF